MSTNIIFKKGATTATTGLPTSTTAGTLYFDTTKLGIYLDLDTKTTGGERITLTEWANAAKQNMLDSFVFGDFNHNNSSQNIILAS